eukprot:CAMPEP_0185480126 /NCGR_PEP_ID=MMETSP1366-20130426/6022_1 /TAXON_ID=38817 /ORGANISM="Gephyrocapsa oceanica, Strain RCC1303" /LENGTH=88 /DNA_ID=CAMNT_0028087611 /DNA_START=52 /DNA_END=316 /DNA_ORIENTATION=+
MQQPFGFCASCASKLGLLDLRTLACGCGHSSDQDTPPSSKAMLLPAAVLGEAGARGPWVAPAADGRVAHARRGRPKERVRLARSRRPR